MICKQCPSQGHHQLTIIYIYNLLSPACGRLCRKPGALGTDTLKLFIISFCLSKTCLECLWLFFSPKSHL